MHEARCTVCPPARFRPFGFPPRGTTTPGYSTLSKMEKINSQQAREATENQFTFASGGWGYPPDPTLTEIQDRRATVTDALHTVNNIQVILVCCRPGDRGGGTETPAASVPRHKVQARHARYSEIRNP